MYPDFFNCNFTVESARTTGPECELRYILVCRTDTYTQGRSQSLYTGKIR